MVLNTLVHLFPVSMSLKTSQMHDLTTRRGVLSTTSTTAAAFAAFQLVPRNNAADLLIASGSSESGTTLPSGVRIFELKEGTGPLPIQGCRVYVHFKLWTRGFEKGVPVDASYFQSRPYRWLLGQPDDRIRAGIDEGTQGMREGGWRRIIVPSKLAYGSTGLPRGTRGAYLVPPECVSP
jgi:peptidylprolyl isomerase